PRQLHSNQYRRRGAVLRHVANTMAVGPHEFVPFERNRNGYGFIRQLFDGALFEPQHLPHATKVNNPVDSRGQRDYVFDWTTDLHPFRTNEQYPPRTDVPGGTDL